MRSKTKVTINRGTGTSCDAVVGEEFKKSSEVIALSSRLCFDRWLISD